MMNICELIVIWVMTMGVFIFMYPYIRPTLLRVFK